MVAGRQQRPLTRYLVSNFLGQNEKIILGFASPLFTLTHTKMLKSCPHKALLSRWWPVFVAPTLEIIQRAVGASIDPGSHVFSRNISGFLQ